MEVLKIKFNELNWTKVLESHSKLHSEQNILKGLCMFYKKSEQSLEAKELKKLWVPEKFLVQVQVKFLLFVSLIILPEWLPTNI